MLVQLQWSLQFVIRFIWPSSAKRCQEEIGEMEKGCRGIVEKHRDSCLFWRFSETFLDPSQREHRGGQSDPVADSRMSFIG